MFKYKKVSDVPLKEVRGSEYSKGILDICNKYGQVEAKVTVIKNNFNNYYSLTLRYVGSKDVTELSYNESTSFTLELANKILEDVQKIYIPEEEIQKEQKQEDQSSLYYLIVSTFRKFFKREDLVFVKEEILPPNNLTYLLSFVEQQYGIVISDTQLQDIREDQISTIFVGKDKDPEPSNAYFGFELNNCIHVRFIRRI